MRRDDDNAANADVRTERRECRNSYVDSNLTVLCKRTWSNQKFLQKSACFYFYIENEKFNFDITYYATSYK